MLLSLTLVSALLTAEPKSAEVQARAKALAISAQKAFKEKKYREAATQFEQALALRPRAALHFNLARCFEELGEVAPTLREYREYLRLAPEATDRALAQDNIAALETRLAAKGLRQLLVVVEPPNAELTVDGLSHGSSPLYVELAPGAHVVTARNAGFQTEERRITVEGTRSPQVVVTLRPVDAPVATAPVVAPVVDRAVPAEPPPAPPLVISEPPPSPRRRVFTWASLALAGVAAGTGLGLGLAANGASNELRTALHTTAQGDALVADVRGFSLGANIAWAVAGTALVAGIALFFLEGAP